MPTQNAEGRPSSREEPAPGLTSALPAGSPSANKSFEPHRQRLDLFGTRCRELVERINVGSISFIDGVDLAYSAAIWSGLVDDVTDDAVQAVMAQAFMRVRPP